MSASPADGGVTRRHVLGQGVAGIYQVPYAHLLSDPQVFWLPVWQDVTKYSRRIRGECKDSLGQTLKHSHIVLEPKDSKEVHDVSLGRADSSASMMER